MLGTISNLIDGTSTNAEPPNQADGLGPLDTTYVTDDQLIDRLVHHLEEDEIPEEHRRALRAHLIADAPTSMDVRFEHLQSKVIQLEAYTEALEAFIDEHGTAEENLADIRRAVERVEDLQSDVDDLQADRAAIRDELTAFDRAIDELDELIHTIEGRHGREIAGVDARIGQFAQEVDERVGDLAADIDSNRADLDDFEGTEERVENNRGRIQEIDSQKADVEDLRTLETDMHELSQEVDELVDFRTKFIRTIAPTPAGPADD